MSPTGRKIPKMPKLDAEARGFFESVVPEHPDVQVRPMFGQLSAFVNGNMFMGVFGADVFVRLPEEDGSKLLKAGGRPFEPMKGRAMSGYVVLPDAWQRRRGKVKEWAARSLDWAEELPPKASSTKTSSKKVSSRNTAASKKSRSSKAKPAPATKETARAKRSRS